VSERSYPSASETRCEPRSGERSREELADYLVEIGGTLAAYGCPSYRVEDVLRLVAAAEGFHAEPLALPTALQLGISERVASEAQVHRLIRVNDTGVDLARLVEIDEIFNDVIAHRTTIEKARARIHVVADAPPAYSGALVFAATVVVSGAAAVFFRGGAVDVLVASIVGAVIAGARTALGGGGGAADAAAPATSPSALEAAATSRRNARRLLRDFFGGVFAASCAGLALRIWPEARFEVIVPAGAITLFPGMTFTTGVAEVAQKHLVSGSARLVESAVTLLLILFGVALVAALGDVVGVDLPSWLGRKGAAHPPGLGLPWQAAALLVSGLAFGALFQVPRRWLWAALASSATGWLVVDAAVRYRLPGHVAAFCGALAVCILSNGLSRFTQRPAQLFQLPGMMLLVPGSFGFLSLGEFLEAQVIDGTQRAFTMALVGAALVVGVLVANILVPSRKLL
jgi:uncharacterized membrane protein YjjP (DUF1212 family)